MSIESFISIGTLIAAVIAACLSYLSILSGSFSKVAEYRKEWNDRLRDDIANLLAELTLPPPKRDEHKLAYLSVRIDLSLDKRKPEYSKLLALKTTVLSAILSGKAPPSNSIEEFKSICFSVLDGQWTRLTDETINAWKFWKLKGTN